MPYSVGILSLSPVPANVCGKIYLFYICTVSTCMHLYIHVMYVVAVVCGPVFIQCVCMCVFHTVWYSSEGIKLCI